MGVRSHLSHILLLPSQQSNAPVRPVPNYTAWRQPRVYVTRQLAQSCYLIVEQPGVAWCDVGER